MAQSEETIEQAAAVRHQFINAAMQASMKKWLAVAPTSIMRSPPESLKGVAKPAAARTKSQLAIQKTCSTLQATAYPGTKSVKIRYEGRNIDTANSASER